MLPAMIPRATVFFSIAALVASCAGGRVLSDQEAQQAHVQNETALSRALAARGMQQVFPTAMQEAQPVAVTQLTVETHAQLGRVIEVPPAAAGDQVLAVDRAGAVHEIRTELHVTEHVREHVHHCEPGTTGGGTPPRGPAEATGQPAGPPRYAHVYYRLQPGQTLGAPVSVVVDTIDIAPIYVTGHACQEIP